MGNYRQSIALDPQHPVIEDTRENGHTKTGFGINAEQEINGFLGCFLRGSYNDGNNETWAFTEIDQTVSAGVSMTGLKWKRENDNLAELYYSAELLKNHIYLSGAYQIIVNPGFILHLNENAKQFSFRCSYAEPNRNQLFANLFRRSIITTGKDQ